MILCAIIPVAVFLNPLWNDIGSEPADTAIVIWICQNICFGLAFIFLLVIAPTICTKFNL